MTDDDFDRNAREQEPTNLYEDPGEAEPLAAPHRRRGRYHQDRFKRRYDRIGGLLVLMAIGVVISPLLSLANLLVNYRPMFENGAYEALTTPGSPHYHQLWAFLIWGARSVAGRLL